MLSAEKSTNKKLKNVIEQFIKVSFENSYVSYKNDTYKSKIGIPTGGSLSRQIADIFLHWIIFVKANPNLNEIEAIRFWKRFIDDCIGVWRGTRRSFDNFVKQLNAETGKYGIKFPIKEVQFGKSVHFLDLNVYLDESNKIQFCGYTKPTDAKRYLNPKSFHPRFVFDSIPFSQILRTLRNNSKQETKAIVVEQCIKEFKNSGYNVDKLTSLKEKAMEKASDDNSDEKKDSLVFPLYYFEGIEDFKEVVYSLKNEIKQLIGDTRVMFAMKKGSSLGNSLVRNKQISMNNMRSNSQRCDATGCLQCPLVNEKRKLIVNENTVIVPQHLNCKSKNVIYMWVCKLCGEKEVYFGRTIQECHNRTNGHRNSFSDEKWDKSALSMHARDVHQMNFSLTSFKISVIKKVSPQQLRREEFKFIDKYKTNSLGLNRYKS